MQRCADANCSRVHANRRPTPSGMSGGLGLMVGVEFTTEGAPDRDRATAAQQLAAQKGLLLLTCGAFMNVVRMIPPLIVTARQVEDALGIWSEVLAEIS